MFGTIDIGWSIEADGVKRKVRYLRPTRNVFGFNLGIGRYHETLIVSLGLIDFVISVKRW